jgi:uncharacterized OB-fold protein
MHIRMLADDRMMCGRQFDPSTCTVYPAKSAPYNELCEPCIGSWQYQLSGSGKLHAWTQDELAYQRATLLSEMRIAADIHDDSIQVMAAVSLRLQVMYDDVKPERREEMEDDERAKGAAKHHEQVVVVSWHHAIHERAGHPTTEVYELTVEV